MYSFLAVSSALGMDLHIFSSLARADSRELNITAIPGLVYNTDIKYTPGLTFVTFD